MCEMLVFVHPKVQYIMLHALFGGIRSSWDVFSFFILYMDKDMFYLCWIYYNIFLLDICNSFMCVSLHSFLAVRS